MERTHLFQQLHQQDATVLLDLLERSYDQMNPNQRRAVFGAFANRMPPTVDRHSLLTAVETFQQESLAGRYYAPFRVNSKNFMDIPEATDEWLQQLSDLLQRSSQLTQQSDHEGAIACFRILFNLIERLDSGEEIVFADEVGSWMIPGDVKALTTAYLVSLAAASPPEEFSQHVVPVLKRDSWNSFANQVYATVLQLASSEQIQRVEAEIERQKIRVPPVQTPQKTSNRSKKAAAAKQPKSQQTSCTPTKRKPELNHLDRTSDKGKSRNRKN